MSLCSKQNQLAEMLVNSSDVNVTKAFIYKLIGFSPQNCERKEKKVSRDSSLSLKIAENYILKCSKSN